MQLDFKFIEMEKEVWKDVIGYEGLYMVSSMGQVKNVNTNRILKQCPNHKGYPKVRLFQKHVGVTCVVHRLVAMAFLPNPEGKKEVDHINTVKSDNRAENLKWCTAKENSNNVLTRKHKSECRKGCEGTCKGRFGKEHNRSIPIVQLSMDGRYIRTWECAQQVQRELGFDNSLVCKVLKGRRNATYGYRWMYLSDYNKEGTVA